MSIPHFEHLTERLRLRTLDPSFAPQLLRYYESNAEFRAQWAPLQPPGFLTIDRQQSILQEEIRQRQMGTQLKCYLFLRSDEELQTIIGFASLSNIVRGAFLSCHLGYEIHGDHADRGLMTEALRAIVDEAAFKALGLHRVEANVMPRNARSIRVLEKLGFREEGIARRYLRINGVWEDHVHYVVLNDELP